MRPTRPAKARRPSEVAQARPAGPTVEPLPCSACGTLLDPLRARHVAILDSRFHYFCSWEVCRARYLDEAPPSAEELPRPSDPELEARRAELEEPIVSAYAPLPLDGDLPEAPSREGELSLVEPFARTILTEAPPGQEPSDPREIGALLLVLAIASGILTIALTLANDSALVLGARLVLALVGVALIGARSSTTPREPGEPSLGSLITPSLLSIAVATWASLRSEAALGSEAVSLAGIVVTSTAIGIWLVELGSRGVEVERTWVASSLDVPGRRAPRSGEAEASSRTAWDLKPGETVLVEAGEIVPVDLVVSGPDVDVQPWVGALSAVRRREGDAVVAGARVTSGRLQGVCTWAGDDRAFARVLLDPRRRGDVLSPIARASRALTERWSYLAGAIGALSALLAKRSAVETALVAVSVQTAFSGAVIASIARVHVARGLLLALRRGITFRSSDAWDKAGQVGVAVFNARGTLLLGEPEVAELETFHAHVDAQQLLSLAAGALRTGEDPVAHAFLRAARIRGVRPDPVRTPWVQPGLGVVAVTSTGEDLCVGGRALHIERRISVAAVEHRISELESLGRTVVLIALAGRLVGLVGLQDGLRPGARAAIQHLVEARIEPVLMSGDGRDTCEAIARSLDVEHVRPEVLPGERATEVRGLVELGAKVAVIGRPKSDEEALGAAEVSVALGAAGAAVGEHSIALASDDVRDAALALALAHRARAEARLGLGLAAGAALLGAATSSLGLLPPAFAPLAGLVGSIAATLHARALDRQNAPADAASFLEGV